MLHGDSFAKAIVDEALDPQAAQVELERIRLGIAFACANLWREPKESTDAIALARRLLPTDSERVTNAILQAFNRADTLNDDSVTRNLLEAISEGIHFRHAQDVYSLIDLLSK